MKAKTKPEGLFFETFETTKVFLDGKHVGDIKEVGGGFAYFPKGRKDRGEIFPTKCRCMMSLA